MDKPKCCISDCQVNSNPKLTHVAFYKLKPKYEKSIIKHHVLLNLDKSVFKLVSDMICARHFHACRLRDHSVTVFFPHLKISVSQTVLCQVSQCSNRRQASATVSAAPEADLSLEKPLSKEKTLYKSQTKHYDHNYALNPKKVRFLKRQRYEIATEINEASRRTPKSLTSFQTEIRQLRKSHFQLETTSTDVSLEIQSPLDDIIFSERVLTFYTGFQNQRSFQDFVKLIAPQYQKALFKERQESDSPVKLISKFGIEKELNLVLCRLRLGLSPQDVAERFSTSKSIFMRMWTFWMKLLSTSLKELSRQPFEISRPANNKMIVKCKQTLFELPEPIGDKLYGRAKALIEITPNGYVYDVSDLYPPSVTDEEILERGFPDEDGENEDKSQFNPQSSHILRISKCINNFKILTQTFPTATLQPVLAEFNSFFKICCFLINFIDKPIIKTREDSKKKKPNSQRKFGK